MIPLINALLSSNPWNDKIKQQPVTSKMCSSFSGWVLSFDLWSLYVWCLGRVCRPRCWFVSAKSISVPRTVQSSVNLVLLIVNNLWIQDMKKSLWWQIRPTLNIFWQISSSPPRTANTWSPPRARGCKNYPCSIALRADWKINRDHRARLVSSNRDWFAYYTNVLIILHTFFTRIRGGDYNASSGFGGNKAECFFLHQGYTSCV